MRNSFATPQQMRRTGSNLSSPSAVFADQYRIAQSNRRKMQYVTMAPNRYVLQQQKEDSELARLLAEKKKREQGWNHPL